MKVVAVVLLVGLAPAARAAPSTGRLTGRVLDPSGIPVAGATVTAESAEVARSAVSATDGTFAIEGLLSGGYRLSATADQRAPGAAMVVVAPDDETTIILTVGAPPEPPRRANPTSGEPLAGLPLWGRTLPAALRLSLAPRGRAGARARSAGAFGDPEWRLDDFDFTHPITGAPAVPVGIEAVAATGASESGPGWWGVGPLATPASASGSNKWEAGGSGTGGLTAGTVAAEVAGPAIRDRLWFALSQAGDAAAGLDGARTLGKLTWQVGPRDKLKVLGALALRQRESARASLAGVQWSSLVRDDLVLAVQLSSASDAGTPWLPPSRVHAARATVELFQFSRALGEHDLKLSGGGALVAVAGAVPTTANRGYAGLEERWRPTRNVTIAGTAGWIAAGDRDGDVAGASGGLSVAWDVSHDGRTALRLRGGSTLVPGLVAVACPDCPRSTRVREAAAGLEREFLQGSAAGAELLARRAHLDGAAPADEREALLALHLRHHRRAYKLSAMYQGRLGPARSELLALAGLGLTPWLSTGAVVIRAPRATWAPLFDETRAGPLGPPPGGSGWLLGLQLHAELYAFLGVRSALWLDALNLAGDRGAVATTPAGAAVPAPPRQLRLGLRVDY